MTATEIEHVYTINNDETVRLHLYTCDYSGFCNSKRLQYKQLGFQQQGVTYAVADLPLSLVTVCQALADPSPHSGCDVIFE